jgi:hypothetical protein
LCAFSPKILRLHPMYVAKFLKKNRYKILTNLLSFHLQRPITMRFFTKEWYFGDLDIHESEEIFKKHRFYVDSIKPKLPAVLRLLAYNINLHDGIIIKVQFSKPSKTLIMEGVFGDLSIGYFKLKFKYKNVSGVLSNQLVNVFRNQVAEILIDEINIISDKKFSHSMIFSSFSCGPFFIDGVTYEIKRFQLRKFYAPGQLKPP